MGASVTALKNSRLNPRTSATGVARVFDGTALWLDLAETGSAFDFHDLIAQERGTFEFQIRGCTLHFVFEFTQKLGEIEVAACFVDDRRSDFASAQNRVETFLHG